MTEVMDEEHEQRCLALKAQLERKQQADGASGSSYPDPKRASMEHGEHDRYGPPHPYHDSYGYSQEYDMQYSSSMPSRRFHASHAYPPSYYAHPPARHTRGFTPSRAYQYPPYAPPRQSMSATGAWPSYPPPPQPADPYYPPPASYAPRSRQSEPPRYFKRTPSSDSNPFEHRGSLRDPTSMEMTPPSHVMQYEPSHFREQRSSMASMSAQGYESPRHHYYNRNSNSTYSRDDFPQRHRSSSASIPIPGSRDIPEDTVMGESWSSHTPHGRYVHPETPPTHHGRPLSRSLEAPSAVQTPPSTSRKWSEGANAARPSPYPSSRYTALDHRSDMVQGSPGSVSLLPRRSGSTPSVAGAPGKQGSRRKEKHNENERKRREEMKSCYASLAQILPELTPFQQAGMDETSAAETGAESDTGRTNRSSAQYTNTSVLQEAVRHIRFLKRQSVERGDMLEYLRAEQARLKQRLKVLSGPGGDDDNKPAEA